MNILHTKRIKIFCRVIRSVKKTREGERRLYEGRMLYFACGEYKVLIGKLIFE